MVFFNKVFKLGILNPLWLNKSGRQKQIGLPNSNVFKQVTHRIYKESIIISLYLMILNKVNIVSISISLQLELWMKCIICDNWSILKLMLVFSELLVFFEVIQRKVDQAKQFIYLSVILTFDAFVISMIWITFFNFNRKWNSIIVRVAIFNTPMIFQFFHFWACSSFDCIFLRLCQHVLPVEEVINCALPKASIVICCNESGSFVLRLNTNFNEGL